MTFAAAPVDSNYVFEMIRRLRTFPILIGARGEEAKDIPSIAATAMKLADIITACPAITDIEVNPLRVYEEGDGSLALDIRILLDNPGDQEPLNERSREACPNDPVKDGQASPCPPKPQIQNDNTRMKGHQ